MTDTSRPRPVMLCVLDGWGWRDESEDNAVRLGRTPNFDRLWESCPHAFLSASEQDVGLPDGQIGNSEVGHMNLGAGRVVLQDLVMIDKAIGAGEFDRSEALGELVTALKQSRGTCHLMGLASPGGVHSHQDHMVALARTVAREGVPVALHLFTDGRDVPPKSAREQVAAMMKDLEGTPGIRYATVSGRYYAMDRDKRWERIEKAYEAMTAAKGQSAEDPLEAIERSYQAGTTDEFILPTVIDGYTGMRDGDGLLMANFRSDRVREILTALLDPNFKGFDRQRPVKFAAAVGMAEYSAELNRLMRTIFPPKQLTRVMGEMVAEAGLTQLRIAETEKYPHVTFFFNGGEEKQYPGEDRILVPSPKVATYDLQPEMSAPEVTDKAVEAIDSGAYDLIVLNYANPDMVGHTGVLEAAIKAVETVDEGLGRIEEAIRRQGGVLLVTADHGNCELMKDPETGGPHTAHTLNKVPVVLVNARKGLALRDGRLADVAPTLLELMKLDQPEEMDGRSLIVQDATRKAAE